MPHFRENISFFDRFAGVYVKGAEFRFRCGGHDGFNNFGDVLNRAVVWGEFRVLG